MTKIINQKTEADVLHFVSVYLRKEAGALHSVYKLTWGSTSDRVWDSVRVYVRNPVKTSVCDTIIASMYSKLIDYDFSN